MAEDKSIKPDADAQIAAVKPAEQGPMPSERPAPHWKAKVEDDDDDDLFDDVPV
jgi:hypothetical protein